MYLTTVRGRFECRRLRVCLLQNNVEMLLGARRADVLHNVRMPQLRQQINLHLEWQQLRQPRE
jgi:hypothetical protein